MVLILYKKRWQLKYNQNCSKNTLGWPWHFWKQGQVGENLIQKKILA